MELFSGFEKEVSWLGLWEGEEVETPYHPSLRHVAFRVEYEELRRAKEWLEERGIGPGKPSVSDHGNRSSYRIRPMVCSTLMIPMETAWS